MSIVLYGATGYTGRLTARELARRGLDFTISGRDEGRLRALGDELGAAVGVRAAALDRPGALRDLLDGARVVIDCAGPFTHLGEPVVQAAVETGTHYVDSTGEQPYMQMVFERYGARAAEAGVALVPGLGFDYVPGDCIARIAADGLEPLEEITLAYAVAGFGASRGTMRSALEMMKGGDLVYEDGTWRRAPGGVARDHFDFPAPAGRQVVTRYPGGEIVTVPRHTETRRVRQLINAAGVAPHPALAPVLPYLAPGLSLALRTPLLRVLDRAVGRLPEGPAAADRVNARFTIVADAVARSGERRRAVVRGSDVYGLTAVTLVHGAALMLEDGFDRTGALPPAGAFDARAFLDHLSAHGLSWEIEGEPARAGSAAR